MNNTWIAERKMIDTATTADVQNGWRATDRPPPIHVCEVARDMFEMFGNDPTLEQQRLLAAVLAQIPPIILVGESRTSYRVIDIMTRVRFNSMNPEWEYIKTRYAGPRGLRDVRDASEIWILAGPRGGVSRLHRNTFVGCHINHGSRSWFERSAEDPDAWWKMLNPSYPGSRQ